MLDITTNSTTNEIINTFSYYPFGMSMAWPYSNNSTTPNTWYQYNNKEYNSDLGLNLLDYGARWYDACIEKFETIDSFGSNNCIKFVDVNGHRYWTVIRDWEKEEMAKFSEFAKNKLREHTENKTKLDCADLAVSVLVDYASSEGLPLQFTDLDGKTIDSSSDKYNNTEEYRKDAMKTIDAKDGSANTEVIKKSEAVAGDMILLTAPARHIVNLSETNPRKLTYGNFSRNKPTEVKTTGDWSNSTIDERGRAMKYLPDTKSAHRWKVLK